VPRGPWIGGHLLSVVGPEIRMSRHPGSDVAGALGQIPCGLFLLTSAHDELRSGILVRWVQRCSSQPPMVMVALTKGQRVEPLIRDSRCFALCQISADDRFLYRKFTTAESELDDDTFVSLMTRCAPSGSPIIERALNYLDCELVRHIELDDQRIYVGQVHHAAILADTKPAVLFGENGVKH
jgi:flavin reductase (DIM6/NTAB) family NADH-FMN oxidoreductase RutF